MTKIRYKSKCFLIQIASSFFITLWFVLSLLFPFIFPLFLFSFFSFSSFYISLLFYYFSSFLVSNTIIKRKFNKVLWYKLVTLFLKYYRFFRLNVLPLTFYILRQFFFFFVFLFDLTWINTFEQISKIIRINVNKYTT